MTAELILIRHGRPQRVENEPGGPPADPPLSPVGADQAQRVAEYLAPEGFDFVYSSPMRRALETAQPLASLLGVDVVVDDELAEYDRAHHYYVPFDELKAAGDPRYELMLQGKLLDGSEVDLETFGRVSSLAVQRVLDAHPGKRIALFAHGGVINAYCSRLLELDRWFFFAPGYTGITRIRESEYNGRLQVFSLNELPHLRDVPAAT